MSRLGFAFKEILAFFQGGYFLITGLWPIVHIESFLFITGPKTDLWLVKALGVLITVVAIAILMAAFRKRISAEVILLAVGAALGLGFIDVHYSLNDTISKAYLWDAGVELVLVVLWSVVVSRRNKPAGNQIF